MEEQNIYEKLAEHLDRLPAGFPRTPTGVEMMILKRLFSPEEAEYACMLTLKPESPQEIASRSGLEPEKTTDILEEMARKGLIFRIRKGNEVRYMAAQFMIGIWEYHVNNLSPELISDLREYIPYFFQNLMNLKTPQLRVIPTLSAVTAVQTIMPYEEAKKLIEEQQLIVAAPCICRKEHTITGEGCDRPLESCLVFGLGAQYYLDNGLGRAITVDEALRILEEAEKDGRVIQPSNSQKIANICTCCGCCCQILKNLKKLDKPAYYVVSRYLADVDENSCVLCGTCVDRCQMGAPSPGDEYVIIDKDRCIGCGLCVTTCPGEAITLKEKPKDMQKDVPNTFMETYKQILQERLALSGHTI